MTVLIYKSFLSYQVIFQISKALNKNGEIIYSNMVRRAVLVVFLLLYVLPVDTSAHISGSEVKITDAYIIQYVIDPPTPIENSETEFIFSIQDANGHDLSEINIKIIFVKNNLDTDQSDLIKEFPIKNNISGDFRVNYTFDEKGDYKVIVYVDGEQGAEKVELPFEIYSDNESFFLNWGGVLFAIAFFGFITIIFFINIMKKRTKLNG